MVSKHFYSVVAAVLLAQAVYCQCSCGSNLNNLAGYGSNIISASNIGVNSLGFGNGFVGNNAGLVGNNLGLVGNGCYGNGGVEIISGNIGVPNNLVLGAAGGVFSVTSGSPVYEYPGGVLVNSENQIGGQVSVTGAVPYAGAVYFGGDVPSTGEATLSYNAGPSVSLNGGGCGYGLSSGANGYGLGGASVINSGLGGSSIINSGFGGASAISNGFGGSCGCGSYY